MVLRALVVTLLVLAVAPAAAPAASYLPPKGKVWAGLTGGRELGAFPDQAGKHPPVYQFFTYWGDPPPWALKLAEAARTRPMFHIGTGELGKERISPGAIARGRGDAYIMRFQRDIADNGRITYIRLMSEMNGHWNPYAAYSANGRWRGRDHSTAMFRQAWRRYVLVMRGGPVAAINRKLRRLRLPPVRGASDTLPRPRVSFHWVPQVAGAPDIRANAPEAYWPGARYVDWVGTDFYSKFPNFAGLERFYARFRGKPFAFGEWAVWDRDDPAFVRRFFAWIRSHGRVRMVMYNRGNLQNGPFALKHYPRAAAELRRQLRSPRYPAYAPEFR